MLAVLGEDGFTSQDQLQRVCSAMKAFKRKREVVSFNRWGRGSESHQPLVRASLWTSCDLSLDESLFTKFVHRFAEEKLGKRSGHANYLFFISTSLIYGKNQQVRKSSLWSKDWKDTLKLYWQDERGLFQRALSCKELFLTKCFLHYYKIFRFYLYFNS